MPTAKPHERSRICVWVDDRVARTFRAACAYEDVHMRDVVEPMMRQYAEKHGFPTNERADGR